MKCYKNLFNIKSIKQGYGSLIILVIILIHIICLIIACAKSNKDFKNLIEHIIKAKKIFIFIENDYFKFKKNINKNFKYKKSNFIKDKGDIEDKNNDIRIHNESVKNKYNKNKIKNINSKNLRKQRKKRKKIISQANEIKEAKNSISLKSTENSFKKDLLKDLKNTNSKIFSLKTENIKEKEKQNQRFNLLNKQKIMNEPYIKKLFSEASIKYEILKIIINPNENEINSYPYKIALRLDKRNYFQYYCSLIKTQHYLFFSFCPINDYNIRIIKIDLFFIDIALNYAINALFFNDDTMHQIYEQILYSTLISNLLSTVIKLPALTEDNVLDIKNLNRNENLEDKKNKIYKSLNIKFIIFCFINSFMLIIFFYYVACFCVIYKNTQMHLIKDSILSYCLSLIYPFIFYLIPGILRIPAINNINNKREILYNISKLIQSL